MEKSSPVVPVPHLLAPIGWLYQAGVRIRNRLYRRGMLVPRRAGVPVVSVGNLTVGGTGKTPFVAYLAARFRDAGRKVAIATRGYGGRRHRLPLVVSKGKGPSVGAKEAGDEAVLLSRLLPSVVVVVGRDRLAAAHLARSRFGTEVVVLDDGFQHRTLHRDLDLVLINAGEGLGNGKMLPLGPLREPVAEIARADAVVVTGHPKELDGGVERARGWLKCLGHDVPVFPFFRRHDGFLRPDSEAVIALGELRGARALVFSGIAYPKAFEADVEALGVEVVGALRFRDHQIYTRSHLQRIRSSARGANADLMITTEKDLTRLGSIRFPLPLYSLRMHLVPRDGELFWEFLSGRLPEERDGTGATQ